jgi:hypothetical protein
MSFYLLSALNNLLRKHLQRMPTKAEWSDFQKHARRMQKLIVDVDFDPVTSETFLPLQLRAANEPFLPRLKSFYCEYATDAFTPLIPFLLSPQTTELNITFSEDTHTVVVASIVSMFPTLCPNLERVTIYDPDREIDLVMDNAVSEMLLGCNRDFLRVFEVRSPLTEEARQVVYQLPKLSRLRTVIEGRTLLPQVVLPNLTEIDVDYDDHLDWLQGFRGAVLGKLERVTFRSEFEPIGDFLGVFAKVTLMTPTQNTLSKFGFYTSQSWTPDYYALLPFKHLKELNIEFTCDDGCSSTVDDDVITALAQAMPKLEILRLGGEPCDNPTGATVHGLIVLASYCLDLSELQIHFQGHTLVGAATTLLTTHKPENPQEGCAWIALDVGKIPLPARSAAEVARMLLQIFPRILNVEYTMGTNREWERVRDHITGFRLTGAFVRRAGKAHPLTSDNPE